MKALLDRYRCLDALPEVTTAGQLSPESGYFHFGPNVVCYGQSSLGSRATTPRGLCDLSGYVKSNGSTLQMPFDPSQVVDNLRLERYTANGYLSAKQTLLSSDAVRKAYYALRPLMDVPLRKHLQRWFLRDWEQMPFPKWPVDRTVENLLETLLSLSLKTQERKDIPFIWFWPEGLPSCAIVTHDVETMVGVAYSPKLMDIDDEFGIEASFQVIPQEQYPASKAFLNEIRDRGYEVNVQDLNHDGNLFNDQDEFIQRARLINQYVQEYRALGFRSGRMYRNSAWFHYLDVSYDMSIPNVAHLEPQRGGCCTVFPYFIGNILEIPLTTSQDYSLFHILNSYSTELWRTQIDLIKEKHGIISFVVHPDYVKEKRALEVYRALLGELTAMRQERQLWIALPREVNRWWRDRSQMRLVQHGKAYRIEGPGKERARVAYASLDGERVTYTLEAKRNDERNEWAPGRAETVSGNCSSRPSMTYRRMR